MISLAFEIAVALAALLIVVVTALPFSGSQAWWVRGWDFPRAQIVIAAGAVLVLALFASQHFRIPILVALAACLIYQGCRILPFTPLMRKEIRLCPDSDGGSHMTVMATNVEMPNDRHDLVRAAIDETDPDILFVMETDQVWGDALSEQLARYPHVTRELRDNYYGLIFATRIEVLWCRVVYLTPDDTPTVLAEMRSADGHIFRFVGLHPKPPVPGNDTADRDAEILYAARFARKTDIPLIAMGDFNDAAWSDTSRRFKKVGEYLDPRVGRGMVASFDANSRLLRAPIDQFFVTREVGVVSFHRGNHVGSDHFPMIARIDVNAATGLAYNRAPAAIDPTDHDELRRIVEKHRQHLGHERYDD